MHAIATPGRVTPRRGSAKSVPPPQPALVRLHNLAGNRAVTALLSSLRSAPPPVLQRCGAIPSEICPCHDEEPTHEAPVLRETAGGSQVPSQKCDEYEPGERVKSFSTFGGGQRSGVFGKDLRIDDFAAGSDSLKAGHIAEIRRLIDDFSLDDPCQESFAVQEIIGFTDGVDREEPNATLRGFRAVSVSEFLRSNGVSNVPDGEQADPTSYDHGCSPVTRSRARAVLVRLRRLEMPATPKCGGTPPVPPTPEEKPGLPKGRCGLPSSRNWQITGIGSGSPPVKDGIALSILLFRLDQKDSVGSIVGSRILQFSGTGPGLSAGLPVAVSLPSPTPFRTTKFVYFEDFQGVGMIRERGYALGAGYSEMRGIVPPRTEPLDLDLSGWQLGFTIGGQVLTGLWGFGPTGQVCMKP